MARSSIALLLLTVASTAGYKCLFIGHSFFVPISKKLPDLAASAAGVTHEQSEVFSGGASGSPSRMWESYDTRNATQTHLDGGDIELFGMTMDGADGAVANTTEGYENWMDYALSKNPSTIFMIGAPWPDFPQDYDTPEYTAMVRGGYTSLVDGIFASLRANPKYLDVTIIENPYALAVIEARLLYEAGGIPDVSALFGGCVEDITGESPCGDALFNDYKGHGGNFLQNLAALVWLNRIYNVDLSVYSSSALSQFTTDMPAVAKAFLDAFDAGSFCGTSTCSTCNVTTSCGAPPVIEPTGCLGDCLVHVTLTIARRTMTEELLENICGMIADAAKLAADAATCTARKGDDAGTVFVDATLETFTQGSGQTVQKVIHRLNRVFTNAELVFTVDTSSPSPPPLPSLPPHSPSPPPPHSPSPPPPSPSPPPPSPSPPSPSPPSPSPPPPSPPACVDTAKKCKNKHCKKKKKESCKKTCGLCEPLPPSAPPSPSLPEVNCGGLSDDEACEIKIKKCEKNPPKSMNKCKKKCKKDGKKKKKKKPLCQKACCELGFFTPA